MSIRIAEAPSAGLDLVRKNAIFDDGLVENVFEIAGKSHEPEIRKPHPVYTATIQGLHDGNFLQSAKLSAWQYLILRDGAPHSLCEVAANDRGGPAGMAYAAHYARSYAAAVAAAMAKAIDAVSHADTLYDVRLLRAPALSLRAIWLHSDHDDLVLPIARVPVDLEPGEPVSEESLKAALQSLADKRLHQNNRTTSAHA